MLQAEKKRKREHTITDPLGQNTWKTHFKHVIKGGVAQ